MTGEPTHTTSKERMALDFIHLNACPNYQLLKSDLWLLRFAFNFLYSITNEEQYEKYLCNQTENLDYRYKCREAIMHYHESTPCDVSKEKWDTKEHKGKSMMCALYILWYAKRHLLD